MDRPDVLQKQMTHVELTLIWTRRDSWMNQQAINNKLSQFIQNYTIQSTYLAFHRDFPQVFALTIRCRRKVFKSPSVGIKSPEMSKNSIQDSYMFPRPYYIMWPFKVTLPSQQHDCRSEHFPPLPPQGFRSRRPTRPACRAASNTAGHLESQGGHEVSKRCCGM